MTEDSLPTFSFSAEEIAKIKEAAGAIDVEDDGNTPLSYTPPKRGPGRPKGSKNRTTIEVPEQGSPELKLAPAPLTKREEREVAKRLSNILTGATGMAGMVKPYLPMTDEEADAISEPLASYLVRNEATSGVAREILENYDLLAMTLGVGAYSVRVYADRRAEISERKPENTTATQRVSELQGSGNGRQPNEGASPTVSLPDATRSGSAPFDI